MPHRVASFFRSSTNTLESQLSSLKKGTHGNNTTQRRQSPPANTNNRSSERVSSYALSIEEGSQEAHPAVVAPPAPARMSSDGSSKHDGESHNKEHHHHRLSFPGFVHIGRASKESHSNPIASLELKVESPPIVFHGDAETSSGALVSGQLFLDVKEDGLPMESLTASLNIHVTQKRPFTPHCHDCTNQYTELQTWSFLKAPLDMTKGVHQFPFSVLLRGHLPATLDGPLTSISYEFKAEAAPKQGHGAPIKLDRVFEVKRSLPTHETPHHSVRVFPPTNIKASVHFPQVIHPTGANTLTLRMDGIAKPNERNGTVEYWKLKKLTWRLEETAKAVAPACERHTPKDPPSPAGGSASPPPPPKKGIQRTDMRIIGEKSHFGGWKSNYDSTEDAVVEMELEYGVGKHFGSADPEQQSQQAAAKRRHTCDGKSRDGTEVSHQLMVEMVVSQEWAPVGRPSMVTQTGVGRILRMHFTTVLTERAGIGISWDNEAPPIYQDVPPSPPAYSEELAAALRAGLVLEEVDAMDLHEGEPPAWSASPTGESSSSSLR